MKHSILLLLSCAYFGSTCALFTEKINFTVNASQDSSLTNSWNLVSDESTSSAQKLESSMILSEPQVDASRENPQKMFTVPPTSEPSGAHPESEKSTIAPGNTISTESSAQTQKSPDTQKKHSCSVTKPVLMGALSVGALSLLYKPIRQKAHKALVGAKNYSIRLYTKIKESRRAQLTLGGSLLITGTLAWWYYNHSSK